MRDAPAEVGGAKVVIYCPACQPCAGATAAKPALVSSHAADDGGADDAGGYAKIVIRCKPCRPCDPSDGGNGGKSDEDVGRMVSRAVALAMRTAGGRPKATTTSKAPTKKLADRFGAGLPRSSSSSSPRPRSSTKGWSVVKIKRRKSVKGGSSGGGGGFVYGMIYGRE